MIDIALTTGGSCELLTMIIRNPMRQRIRMSGAAMPAALSDPDPVQVRAEQVLAGDLRRAGFHQCSRSACSSMWAKPVRSGYARTWPYLPVDNADSRNGHISSDGIQIVCEYAPRRGATGSILNFQIGRSTDPVRIWSMQAPWSEGPMFQRDSRRRSHYDHGVGSYYLVSRGQAGLTWSGIVAGALRGKGEAMTLASSSYSYPLLGAFWTILEIFLWVIWFWILITVFVDIFRSHDLSGWGKALWFLFVLIIPLIGVLVYLVVRGGSMHERMVRQAQRQDEEFRSYVQETAGSQSPADQLTKLADLRDRGVITAEEFEREKAKVLA